MSSWGFHAMLNCGKCVPSYIRSPTRIKNFANALVHKIDMVAYGEPQIVMFGTGNKKGYTLIQLIETSNIAGHFVEETDDLYLDVFSCKKFHPKDVEEVVYEYFDPMHIELDFFIRNALYHTTELR